MKVVTRYVSGKEQIASHEGSLPVALFKGMPISLDPGKPSREVERWSYFRDETHDESGVVVQFRERKTLDDAHEQLNIVLAVVTVIAVITGALLMLYQPTLVKACLGYVLRPVVGFGSWLALIGLGLYAERKIPDSPKLGSYLRWTFGFTGAICGFVLAVALLPANPLVQFPDDYSMYFESSVKTLQGEWKILAGIAGYPLFVFAFLTRTKKQVDHALNFFGGRGKG